MWGAARLPPQARREGEQSQGESRAVPWHLGFTAGWFAKATHGPCQPLSSSSVHISSRIAYTGFSLSG